MTKPKNPIRHNDLVKYDPIQGCFVLKDTNPPPPANAFEWRRFVKEEDIRRGEAASIAKQGSISRKRSVATTKSLERIRETQPGYGTLQGMSSKTERMIALKPKTFTIYSKAQISKQAKDKR